MSRLILASASPRRISLLHQVGIEAEVIPSRMEETFRSEDPQEMVLTLSAQKAHDVASGLGEDCIVLGADTVVSIDGRILGKPADHEKAYEMISGLSGKWHQVFTGVTICRGDHEISFAEKTSVHVVDMTEEEIRSYADSEEPMDKAGGYGIQGFFGRYIDRIDGDYNNVVGLPVARVYQALKSFCGYSG